MTNQELCVYLAKCYSAGSDLPNDVNKITDSDIDPQYFEGSSIAWFKVGHNASHSFYLGTDNDGCMFKCSYEGNWDYTIPYHEWRNLVDNGERERARQYEKWVEDIYITKVDSSLGYIGHW